VFCVMSTVKNILIVSLNTFLCNGDILVYDVLVKLPNILSFLVLAFLSPRVYRCPLLHLTTLNDTYTHKHCVGLLWTRDRPLAENFT